MAQRTVTLLEDDLEGGGAAETIEFGLDGAQYAVDLNEDNASRLRDSLAEFVAAARRIGGTTRRRNVPNPRRSSEVNPKVIRTWATENGYEVSARGRIPASIVEAYRRER
jgi:hypothetical protein